MLLALRSVDYVHVVEEPVPAAFVEAVRPDVHVAAAEAAAAYAPTMRAV
jgi:bifunctional ADP-heptose synthase (sugar kinase/adenylyltransferase)